MPKSGFKSAQPGSAKIDAPHQPQTARRDPLTGLFDQDHLNQELEKTLAKSRDEPVAATLALLQLENFYEIRSWVGRSEANLLLSDIAQLLVKSLPESVLLCRCQHYEFAALLFDECSVNARLITDRVKLALQSEASSSIPPQLELRCGVGLASVASNIPSAEVMFARARHSLSLAHYRTANDAQMPVVAAIPVASALAKLQQALQAEKLQLTFQPLVSLKEDGLKHYEVRTRLPGEEGSLPASILFEAAIQNAMGAEVDRWVIRKVLLLLRHSDDRALRLTISLTQNSLVSPRFFDWLQKTMAKHSSLGEQLVFQISEIDVLIAQHHMDYVCQNLNQLNIKLTISNFGCTADPFRYLPLLRAHFVKLDVSLLEKINVDPHKSRQLAKTVTKLHENGLRVIAAMLEDMSILPLLWKARVNFIQGHCMQEPGTTLDFEFLREQTIGLQRK